MHKAVADTSVAAYVDLLPTLSRREQEVLEALRGFIKATQSEPTGYELAKWMGASDPNVPRPRLTALKAKGLVVNLQQRRCTVTGKTCWTWCPSYPGRLF